MGWALISQRRNNTPVSRPRPQTSPSVLETTPVPVLHDFLNFFMAFSSRRAGPRGGVRRAPNQAPTGPLRPCFQGPVRLARRARFMACSSRRAGLVFKAFCSRRAGAVLWPAPAGAPGLFLRPSAAGAPGPFYGLLRQARRAPTRRFHGILQQARRAPQRSVAGSGHSGADIPPPARSGRHAGRPAAPIRLSPPGQASRPRLFMCGPKKLQKCLRFVCVTGKN